MSSYIILYVRHFDKMAFLKWTRSWPSGWWKFQVLIFKVKFPYPEDCMMTFFKIEIFHAEIMRPSSESDDEFSFDICHQLMMESVMRISWCQKILSFWRVELLSQKGRRMLYFGFEDIDFQTYRCPK